MMRVIRSIWVTVSIAERVKSKCLQVDLHDQNRRTVVGDSGVLATNSVLAVAGDAEGTLSPGRLRAMRACSAMVTALAPFMPGGMGRYDEDWSPRAFGDNVTAWGTPVVLLESGGLPAGHEMTDLTRLNFVALLMVLRDLAVNDLEGHDRRLYDELPRNRSGAWVDVAIRGGSILQPGSGVPYRADIVFNVETSDQRRAGCESPVGVQPDARVGRRSRIVEIGDTRFLAAGRDVDATDQLVLPPWIVGIRGGSARAWLDVELLENLTSWGVGTILWAVSADQFEAAASFANGLAGPGRASLRITSEGASPPPLILSGPPQRPRSDSLDELLNILGEESWPQLRAEKSLIQALPSLWPEGSASTHGSPPTLGPGQVASFLLISTSRSSGKEAETGRLVAVWVDGRRIYSRTPQKR